MPDDADVRLARIHDEVEDQRTPTQRDCDRVLYTSAFARLGGIAQVVSSDEGHPYHNRLIHSLKVAQIARRIAEHLAVRQETAAREAGIDPDACEAAALAHDLGHPPFGHIAEKCLDGLVRNKSDDGVVRGDDDGFEGNAQTFRVVVRLAQRRDEFDGLNLTRATLEAILKYPRLRVSRTGTIRPKYGAYQSESETLDWTRRLHAEGDEERCANADIMNWADDVAYAVHDVEDFYRSGLVSLDRLYWSQTEQRSFLGWLHSRWTALHEQEGGGSPIPVDNWDLASRTMHRLFTELPLHRVTEPYKGERAQRKILRRATAFLIGRYLTAVQLEEANGAWRLGFADGGEAYQEVEVMKEIIWYYVIDRPALRTQQHGQQRIVSDLFTTYKDAVTSGDHAVLPVSMREAVMRDDVPTERAAADAVASLTEQQAVVLWRKLTGVAQGTLLDYPIG